MKKKKRRSLINIKSLDKLKNKGFKGYPIATIAYYGPNNKIATKISVGIIQSEEENTDDIIMKKWYSKSISKDVRGDPIVEIEILKFIEEYNPKSVVVADRIMGCPHEEGIDYPEGEVCKECVFWINRDRFTGEMIQ